MTPKVTGTTVLLCLLFLGVPLVRATSILDGVREVDYGSAIATDPGGDLASHGVEFMIPLSDLGMSVGDTVNMIFWASQSGAGKGAYDTVLSDDQSTGWDDPTTRVNSVAFVAVPEPTTAGLLMLAVIARSAVSKRHRR